MPKIEAIWAGEGQPKVPTLGYTKRINIFICLFWPLKKIVWDIFKRRRNIEFRKHLSHMIAYAKRHKIRRIILFVDHATYHKTPEVKKFAKEHKKILTIKFLGKKDPNSNPTECIVNKRLNSAVCVNRCHASLDAMKVAARNYLRKYNSIYAT